MSAVVETYVIPLLDRHRPTISHTPSGGRVLVAWIDPQPRALDIPAPFERRLIGIPTREKAILKLLQFDHHRILPANQPLQPISRDRSDGGKRGSDGEEEEYGQMVKKISHISIDFCMARGHRCPAGARQGGKVLHPQT